MTRPFQRGPTLLQEVAGDTGRGLKIGLVAESWLESKVVRCDCSELIKTTKTSRIPQAAKITGDIIQSLATLLSKKSWESNELSANHLSTAMIVPSYHRSAFHRTRGSHPRFGIFSNERLVTSCRTDLEQGRRQRSSL